MSRPLHIAVIADSHDKLPPALPPLLAGADEIWHLGDVCDERLLHPIRLPERPLRVIRGNTDFHHWPLTLDLVRNGLRLHLVHIPPAFLEIPPETQVVLHGHTHVPRDETVRGIRFLNPGSVSFPRENSRAAFAWLDIATDASFAWSTVPLPQ
jgi:putative phosphoesterase